MSKKIQDDMELEKEKSLQRIDAALEKVEDQKAAVSSEYDQKAIQAAKDALNLAQQPVSPPPHMPYLDLVSLHTQGNGELDNIKETVLRQEEERLSREGSQFKGSVTATPAHQQSAPDPNSSNVQTSGVSSNDTPQNESTPLHDSAPSQPAASNPNNASQPPGQLLPSRNDDDQQASAPIDTHTRRQNLKARFAARLSQLDNMINDNAVEKTTGGKFRSPVTSGTSLTQNKTSSANATVNQTDQPPVMSRHSYAGHQEQALNPDARSFQPVWNQNSERENQDRRFTTFEPQQSFGSVADSAAVTQLLADAVRQNRLPVQEPLTFNGDPLQYPAWRATFYLLIESQTISETEKLLYLQRYVSGPAKEAISGSFMAASTDAYKTAMSTLDQRFGSPFVLSTAFREKLERWPVLKSRDGEGLRRLADFLTQCLSASHLTGQQSTFEDVHYQHRLMEKMPEWMANRWKRIYSETRQNDNMYPSFAKFVEFVQKEANVANEPGLSSKSQSSTTDTSHPRGTSTSYVTTASTPVSQNDLLRNIKDLKKDLRRDLMKDLKRELEEHGREVATYQTSVPQNGIKPPPGGQQSKPRIQGPTPVGSPRPLLYFTCRFCKGTSHEVTDCRALGELPVEQRLTVFNSRNLCLSCSSSTHATKDCQRPKTCLICKGSHPSVFHSSKNQSANDTPGNRNLVSSGTQANILEPEVIRSACTRISPMKTSSDADTQAVIAYSCQPTRTTTVSPVYVSSEEEPEKEILVYALVDTQSAATFVAEELARQLVTKGYDHHLIMNTMTAQNKVVPTKAVLNLRVRPVHSDKHITLKTSYSSNFLSVDPQTIPTPEIALRHEHLKRIAPELHEYDPRCIAGLLIGFDNPIFFKPEEVIDGEPFAMRTCLGWAVIGESRNIDTIDDHFSSPSVTFTNALRASIPAEDAGMTVDSCEIQQPVVSIFRTRAEDASTTDVLNLLERDFIEKENGTKSQEDMKFLDIIDRGITVNSTGHYEMPLPFKNGEPNLPNNRSSTFCRLKALERQLLRDERKREHYMTFMADLIQQGHAEKIPANELHTSTQWYIPHHGVYNDKKPDKIRVVFDCSAHHKGTSLNDHLLQGPDLINPLVGVLLRFRKGRIALSCDIKQMYHQFHVTQPHRDFLRFLWWENGDMSKPPADYRMTVHIFGATSSPGCANFGLKQIARDHHDINPEAAQFLEEDFYVDDGLHASDDVSTATSILRGAIEICGKAEMTLHKITSNSAELLSHFPAEARAPKKCQDLGLNEDSPVERILGLQWSTEDDVFTFPSYAKNKPTTKRGMLSTIAALYDPLGFIGPLVLKGRILLQQVCRENCSWDDPLPESVNQEWTEWQKELTFLNETQIPRSFIPQHFGTVLKREIHHFSDASERGYGQCSYLRLQDDKGQTHCSLIMAKSRVTPLKASTIPRLELQAATLSVRMAGFLDRQLHYQDLQHHFWTDSTIVLAYLANTAKRFHVFVANRVGEIMRFSNISQWSHVPTSQNPADIASRGANVRELHDSIWYTGPDFLWQPEVSKDLRIYGIPEDDLEVHVCATTVSPPVLRLDDNLQHSSSWPRLVRGIATVLRKWSKTYRDSVLTDIEMEGIARKKLVRSAQQDFLQNPSPALLNSMVQLGCRRNSDELIVVGGRHKNKERSPVLLPRDSYITRLISQDCHRRQGHAGRTTTVHAMRALGFWVIGIRRVISSLIKTCTHCIRMYGKPMSQQMADLPEDRVSEAPPFAYCGIDCFGPFTTKDARRSQKRYGLIITCLASRAVHIELLDDMTTDSFINALRNVIAIRGAIRMIRSDRGTNFVGASRELRRAWEELPKNELQSRLKREYLCEWIFNPPAASHVGGVWERLIRSARRILNGLLSRTEVSLTTSALRTVLYEVMAIMNSRPLSVDSLEDPTGPIPLTPNHILTLKSTGILPPPGAFDKTDLYHRKMWRKVQHLADHFWERWRRDYLNTLQSRRKWLHRQPNLSVGDIVLIRDEGACRGDWKMARVEEVFPGDDGLVRRCRLRVAKTSHATGSNRGVKPTYTLERHVRMLVLFVQNVENVTDSASGQSSEAQDAPPLPGADAPSEHRRSGSPPELQPTSATGGPLRRCLRSNRACNSPCLDTTTPLSSVQPGLQLTLPGRQRRCLRSNRACNSPCLDANAAVFGLTGPATHLA